MHRCAVGPRQPCILRYSVCTQQDAIFHKKSHNQLHALICCSWVNSVRKIFCSASLGYNTVVPTHFHTNMCLLALIRHWPTTQPGSRARSLGPSLLLYGNVRLPWHILGFFCELVRGDSGTPDNTQPVRWGLAHASLTVEESGCRRMPQIHTSMSVLFTTDEDAARQSYRRASQPTQWKCRCKAVRERVRSQTPKHLFSNVVITQFRRFNEKDATGD